MELWGLSASPPGSSTAAAHDENGEIRRDGWASESVADEDEEPLTGSTLSGEQDAAIAGIVTTLLIVCANVYWGAVSRRASFTGEAEPAKLRWGPLTHAQFWFAMVGGAMNFLHYYFLLKAFEGAPSTVLLPLVQVASVSVLLGSAVISMLRHETWITPTHALAYLLMFIGGILPACAGQLTLLVSKAFVETCEHLVSEANRVLDNRAFDDGTKGLEGVIIYCSQSSHSPK